MALDIVEGWTQDLEFQLKSDGVAVDLTGILTANVTLILTNADGTSVTTTSDISISDATNGKVKYSPDAGDLLAVNSPLSARFKVIDADGKIVFFPSAAPDKWTVYKP